MYAYIYVRIYIGTYIYVYIYINTTRTLDRTHMRRCQAHIRYGDPFALNISWKRALFLQGDAVIRLQ